MRRVAVASFAAMLMIASVAAGQTRFTFKIKQDPDKGGAKANVVLDFHSEDPSKPGRIPLRTTRLEQIEPGHWNFAGLPRCPFTTGADAVAHGGCPDSSEVGTGTVKAAVTTQPNASRAAGTVKVFNGQPVGTELARFLFVITTTTVNGDGLGALPPGLPHTTTLESRFQRRGRNKIVTIQDVPEVHPIPGDPAEVVLTDLHLTIEGHGHRINAPCPHGHVPWIRIVTLADGSQLRRTTMATCHR